MAGRPTPGSGSIRPSSDMVAVPFGPVVSMAPTDGRASKALSVQRFGPAPVGSTFPLAGEHATGRLVTSREDGRKPPKTGRKRIVGHEVRFDRVEDPEVVRRTYRRDYRFVPIFEESLNRFRLSRSPRGVDRTDQNVPGDGVLGWTLPPRPVALERTDRWLKPGGLQSVFQGVAVPGLPRRGIVRVPQPPERRTGGRRV